MDSKTIALMLLLLLLGAACAPGSFPDAPEPTRAGLGEQANFAASAEENIPEPGKVTPVSVDLGRITPEPGIGEAEIIQPAPGVPNPERKLASLASQDLSQRLDVDVSQVKVVQIETVEWPDSSLGCPQPGFDYLMVITPGYLIVLEAGGQQYQYHTDQTERAVLCPDGRPQ